MVPAQPVQLAHVGEFEHSAVGFGAVPAQVALESYLLHNLLCTLAYAELFARANVDVAVADFPDAVVIDLHLGVLNHILEIHIQQAVHAGIRHLFAPKELTHGCSCTPKGHAALFDAVRSQHREDILLA